MVECVAWPALFLALGSAGTRAAEGVDAPSSALGYTLDDVTRAWQAREQRLRSARAEWTETVFHPRGSLIRGPQANPAEQAEVLPPSDRTVEIRCRLVLDGAQSRLERSGPLWSFDHAEFHDRDFVSVFGLREQGQYFSEVPGKHVPVAMLREELRRGATHAELLVTKTGQAALGAESAGLGWSRVALLGAAAIGLVVGAIGAWLAFSRRARPGTR
jgi:hypothetical protein